MDSAGDTHLDSPVIPDTTAAPISAVRRGFHAHVAGLGYNLRL
jgi:hypothetical protein